MPVNVILLIDLELRASASVMGAGVASSGFVRALADYSSELHLAVYVPAGWRRQVRRRLSESPLADRAALLDESQLREAFPADQPVVIQVLGIDLSRGLHLRWLCGSPAWPVVGLTYALSPASVFRDLTLAALGPLQPYDAVVCASSTGREVVAGMFRRLGDTLGRRQEPRRPVIPLGIDTEKMSPLPRAQARALIGLPEDAVIFLFLGRLNPQYKADLLPLLEALSRLDEGAKILLLVAGFSAPNETALVPLRFRCAELGLSDRVRWYVDVSRQRRLELLSAADVFVSPVDSLQETFGLAVAEAMACGLPVIAADWNGYRDLVKVPECGRLITTRMVADLESVSWRGPLEATWQATWDLHWEIGQATAIDVAELAAAMAELALDADLRQSMGQAAQIRARDLLDWARVVDTFCAEWEALDRLARQTGPPPATSPYWYDHGVVFGSYPSARLTSATRIRRRPVPTAGSVLLSPPPFLRRELLERLLDQLVQPSAIESLAGDPLEVQRHVAYLLKQGQVEIEE